MKVGFKFSFLILSLLGIIPVARAQAPISSMALGPDQIGKVRTAPGITTKISFPDKVFESICGDLYDASSGKGTFVIQQSGNDVFLKPIAPRGMSNLFVKVGDNGKHTYNFDLEVVTVAQAHRVVNVTQVAAPAQPSEAAPRDTQPSSNGAQPPAASNQPTADEEKLTRKSARPRSTRPAERRPRFSAAPGNRPTAYCQRRSPSRLTYERGSAERSKDEVERRFVKALMLGLREAKINNPRVQAKKVIISLDPRVLTLDDKSYLRYTIQNAGTTEFTFSSISLETVGETESKPITIQIVQNKAENKLEANESLAGVIIFDASLITAKDKLRLYVRGEDSAEIARVNIQ